MPAVKAERVEERRRRIREAAVACFRRDGFHQTGMARICAEAGMSPGNLYRYYASKEAIIEAIVEEDRRRDAERFAALRATEDVLGGLMALADEAFTGDADDPETPVWADAAWACEIFAEAGRNARVAAILRRARARDRDDLTAALRLAQGRGQVAADLDARQTAAFVIAAADGLFEQMWLTPDVDRAAFAALFKDMVLRLVRPAVGPKAG